MKPLNNFIIPCLLAGANRSYALQQKSSVDDAVEAVIECEDGRFIAGDTLYAVDQDRNIVKSNDTTPCERMAYAFHPGLYDSWAPMIPGDGTVKSALLISFSGMTKPAEQSFLDACNDLSPITGRPCMRQSGAESSTPFAMVSTNSTDGQPFVCDPAGFTYNREEEAVAGYIQYDFNITEPWHVTFDPGARVHNDAAAAMLCILGTRPLNATELTEELTGASGHVPESDQAVYFQLPPEGVTVRTEGTNTSVLTDFDRGLQCLDIYANRYHNPGSTAPLYTCLKEQALTMTCDYQSGDTPESIFIGDVCCRVSLLGVEKGDTGADQSPEKNAADKPGWSPVRSATLIECVVN